MLDTVDYKSAVVGARGHLIGLLITYARVDAPEMSHKPDDYWKGDKIDQAAWDPIIKELMEKDWEYHVVKVFYFVSCFCLIRPKRRLFLFWSKKLNRFLR